MVELYAKLRTLSRICENKADVGVTKQTWSDTPFIIRGKDEGVPVWHYILVPFDKIGDIKNQEIGGSFDCNSFGSIIKYRDKQGQIVSMSGWGTDPPQSLQIWFDQHYDNGTVDENIRLEYLEDDIRLCTMQRLTSDQLIGIYRRFNKQNQFHYIELFEDHQTTLAYRAGIKNFDRFICLNGVNIEQETVEQITKRFKDELDLPVQILVCSPATYHHYKSNNMIIHSHLPTVQHLKPVFDRSNKEIFLLDQIVYVIQWENSFSICIVCQSSIFKSPDLIHVNDICFVEVEGQYRKGKIKFRGSQDECQHWISQLQNGIIDQYTSDCESISSSKMDMRISSDEIILGEKSRFCDLPNELLFDLFNYLTLEELHNAFSGLNSRINNLLLSRYNVSFIFNEEMNPLLIKFYGHKINQLIIDTSDQCDLTQFSNLHSLILRNRNANNLIQIRPEIVPNLVHLSFLLKCNFKPPVELVNNIFSNRFPYIRHVNLGLIDKSYSKSWSTCPSLRIVSIRCDQSMIIRDILQSCPNLYHLQYHILHNYDTPIVNCSLFNHPLQRFTLWSDELEIPIDLIDSILSYMINLERLYIQTKLLNPLIELLNNIINRLNNLSRFDCFIKELINKSDRIDNLNNIYKISSCFNRIQCIKQNDDFTIFATE